MIAGDQGENGSVLVTVACMTGVSVCVIAGDQGENGSVFVTVTCMTGVCVCV